MQTAHAAIAATLAWGDPKFTHPHLVVCAVPDERALAAAFEMLKAGGTPCLAYREPDMGDALTAVATAPLRGKERRPLRQFPLLRD